MVFIFASIFEFSTLSTSMYCALWSVAFLDAAGLSTAIGASDTAGLFGEIEALDVLGLLSVCGGTVLLYGESSEVSAGALAGPTLVGLRRFRPCA
jgi:hypothetical protein